MFIIHYLKHRWFICNKSFRKHCQSLVMIFVYKVKHIRRLLEDLFSFISSVCLLVSTENPSVTSIQSQISSNGMSIPHQIERSKDSPLWHLKFRPYTPGNYKIHLTCAGLPLLSKKTSLIRLSKYSIEQNENSINFFYLDLLIF